MQIVALLLMKLPCENSGTKGPKLCIVVAYLAPVRGPRHLPPAKLT